MRVWGAQGGVGGGCVEGGEWRRRGEAQGGWGPGGTRGGTWRCGGRRVEGGRLEARWERRREVGGLGGSRGGTWRLGGAQGGWGPGGAWGGVGRHGEVQGGRGARAGRKLPLPSLPYTGPLARPHHTQPPCDSHPACRVGRKERGQHPGRDKSHPKNRATGRSRATAPQHRHTQPPAAAAGEEPRHQPGCGSPATPTGSLVAALGQTLDCWTLVSTSSGALVNQVKMQLRRRRRPRSEQQDWRPRQEATPSGLSLPPALPSSWHTSLLWDPLVRGKGDTSLSAGVARQEPPRLLGVLTLQKTCLLLGEGE